jgi:isocitrate/isopropylmalate dehydrogenase
LLLQYIGFNNAAKAIEISVDKALAAGIVTADINSDNASSTTQVGDFIAENVKKEAAVLA